MYKSILGLTTSTVKCRVSSSLILPGSSFLKLFTSRLLTNTTGYKPNNNLWSSNFNVDKNLTLVCFGHPYPRIYDGINDNSKILNKNFKRSFMSSRLSQNKLKQQENEFVKQSNQLNEAAAAAAASGNLFQRLAVRIKHLLVRDTTKLSGFDTVSAFISWLVMGHLLWIVLGTSSFALALLYSIHYYDKLMNNHDNDNDSDNRNLDESFLGWLASSILSHGLGVSIDFEKGKILPQFKDGKLRFSSLKITSLNKIDDKPTLQAYVDHVDMTLSFNKWYEGNGLIYDLDIFGLNGKIYHPNKNLVSPVNSIGQESYDSTSKLKFASTTNTNNNLYHLNDDHYIENEEISEKLKFLDSSYHLDHVTIHDSYCEIYNDLSSSPLKIIVFSGDFSSVNGNRLILDFFNANNVSGAINDSMFTIHKRQNVDFSNDKVIRFKIDGIDMGTISSRNPNSKFNWIIGGKAHVLADIKFPNEENILESDYNRISRVFNELINDLTKVTSKDQQAGFEDTHDEKQLLKGALAAIYHTFTKPEEPEPTSPYIVVDFKVKFTDLKASLPQNIPLSTSNIPFVSLHNLRSLIQLINEDEFSNDPITIKTTVIEKLSDLYNIPDISTTKIFDSIISDIYEDLLKMVKQHETRIMSEKSNSWSHSIASQLLLLGLGVLV